MKLPRVFVGTLYSGEGDFVQSMELIRAQVGVEVSHTLISDMQEKPAHNALWKAWRDHKSSHDLFVKVDADTVLRSVDTLRQVWELFAANPRVTGVQALLHDYMTDSLINGLNCFGTQVVFNDTQDDLYCDRQVDTGHDVVLRGGDVPPDLSPAGWHCHHATPKQAFHYGLHRALKGQSDNIARVRRAWVRDRDDVRAYALIGAAAAPRFERVHRFNYADPEFQAAFEEAQAGFATQVVAMGEP